MQQLNCEEILRLPYGKGIGSRNIAQVLGVSKDHVRNISPEIQGIRNFLSPS